MINVAIVGLGWWGKTLVEALADGSNVMRLPPLPRGRCRWRSKLSPRDTRYAWPQITKRCSTIDN